MPSKQERRTPPETYNQRQRFPSLIGNSRRPQRVGLGIAERVMNGRHFHHQPRSRVTAIGPIAHADEDDDQIETWMIGQGQEARGNRHAVVRRAGDLWGSVPTGTPPVLPTPSNASQLFNCAFASSKEATRSERNVILHF